MIVPVPVITPSPGGICRSFQNRGRHVQQTGRIREMTLHRECDNSFAGSHLAGRFLLFDSFLSASEKHLLASSFSSRIFFSRAIVSLLLWFAFLKTTAILTIFCSATRCGEAAGPRDRRNDQIRPQELHSPRAYMPPNITLKPALRHSPPPGSALARPLMDRPVAPTKPARGYADAAGLRIPRRLGPVRRFHPDTSPERGSTDDGQPKDRAR